MRRWVKRLTVLAFVAAGGWSLWWYVGAAGQESGIARWFEKQRQRGWMATFASLEVSGYPTDFNTQAREIALSDPRAGWTWRVPIVSAQARAHAPTRIEVTWPTEQTFALPGDNALIRSEQMRTLLDLRPGLALELREMLTRASDLTIRGGRGWAAGLRSLRLHLAERSGGQIPSNSYRLDLDAREAKLPAAIVAAIDPSGRLKPIVERMTVRANMTFARPIDRKTFRRRNLDLRSANIDEAGFQWGEMSLRIWGDVEVDQFGYPNGRIRIEARQWRQMLHLAARNGLIRRKMVKSVSRAVGFLTRLSGRKDRLMVMLVLKGGKVMLGPVAIARAPRLAAPAQ